MKIIRRSHLVLLSFCLLAGMGMLSLDLLSAQDVGLPDSAVDLSYATAERNLAEAQLTYVTNANERSEGLYPDTLLQKLRMKIEVIDEYIKQHASGDPDMQVVLVKKATSEVKIAELRLAQLSQSYENGVVDQDRVRLGTMALDVAKQGLARVKSLKTPEELRQWEIGQLQLQLLDVQMRVEVAK